MKQIQLLLTVLLFLIPYTAKAAIVTVSSNITTNTTWTTGNTYHITSIVSLNSGVTLTVQEGVVVKFNPGTYLNISGNMQSIGTSGNKINYTSRDDNTVGENVPGSDGVPTKGDWTYLYIVGAGSNASVLENIVVKYPSNGVYMDGSSAATLRNSVVNKSLTYGIFVGNVGSATISGNSISESNGYGLYVYGNSPTITNNTITNNSGAGLYINGGTPNITNNTVTNNGGKGLDCRAVVTTFTGNSFSGNAGGHRYCSLDPLLTGAPGGNTFSESLGSYTEVQNFNMISTSTGTLPNLGIPIVIYGGTLVSGKTLTLTPGSIFRMYGYPNIQGNLQAIGTASEPIVFTSKDDNTYGGNIAGISDGVPAKGDWTYLYIVGAGSNASVLDNVVVRYTSNGVYMDGSSAATLRNSVVNKSLTYGIFVGNVGSATISGNSISESNGYGVYVYGNSPTITNNTITNNSGAGLYINGGTPSITNNTVTNNGGKGLDCRAAVTTFTGNSFSGNTGGHRYCSFDPLITGALGGNTFSEALGSYVEVHAFNIISTSTGTLPNIGIPIVIYGGTLASGKTLTIAPGNIFRIALYPVISGNLQAIGTASEPIVFTSKDDNTYGGNIAGISDGVPTKGDWSYLYVVGAGSNASVLENLVIRYAGEGIHIDSNSNVTVRNSVINKVNTYGVFIYGGGTISGNTISESNSYGIYVYGNSPTITSNTITSNSGAGLYLAGGTPSITNNTVTNNTGKGVDCRAVVTTFTGNSFSGNAGGHRFCSLDPLVTGNSGGNTFSESLGSYTEVQNFNMISTSTGTLPNLGVPIVIYGGTLVSGKTLTIAPGNIFRMYGYPNIQGNLQAIGTVSEPIVFTSKDDNTYGGNIAGISDGVPTKGDWSYLYINGAGSNASVLDNVVIKYAGEGVHIDGVSTATVRNSVINKVNTYGIFIYGGGTISGNTISESNSYGIYVWGSSPTIRNNTIVKNTGVGIYNQATTAVIKNNISYGNNYGIQCNSAMGTNIKYNLINGNTTGRQNGTSCTLDSTNLDANPLFTNYTGGDYSLQAGSPAIDGGDAALGNHPLSGNRYDIGAIEFINGIIKISSAAIYNPEGKTLTYTWSFIADPTNGVELPVFSGVSSGITSSVNANVSVAFVLKYLGNYTLKLTITEGGNPVITNSYNFTVQ